MQALFEIFIKPAWYWFVTIIPAVLGIIGAIQNSLPESQRSRFLSEIYNLLPFWGWFMLAAISFIVTTLISVNTYLKRYAEKPVPTNTKEVHGEGIVAEKVNKSPVIKAEGADIVSGRDTNVTNITTPGSTIEKNLFIQEWKCKKKMLEKIHILLLK